MHTCVYIHMYIHVCIFIKDNASCIIKLYYPYSNVASVRNIPCYKYTKIRFWVKSESSNNLRNKSALYQCLLSVHPAGLRVLSWWRNQVQPLHALVLEGRSLSHHKHLCCLHNGNNNRKNFTHELQHSICESFNILIDFFSLCFSCRRLAFVATPGGPCRKACQMFSTKLLRRYIPSNGGCTIPRGCKADKQIQHFGGR